MAVTRLRACASQVSNPLTAHAIAAAKSGACGRIVYARGSTAGGSRADCRGQALRDCVALTVAGAHSSQSSSQPPRAFAPWPSLPPALPSDAPTHTPAWHQAPAPAKSVLDRGQGAHLQRDNLLRLRFDARLRLLLRARHAARRRCARVLPGAPRQALFGPCFARGKGRRLPGFPWSRSAAGPVSSCRSRAARVPLR